MSDFWGQIPGALFATFHNFGSDLRRIFDHFLRFGVRFEAHFRSLSQLLGQIPCGVLIIFSGFGTFRALSELFGKDIHSV